MEFESLQGLHVTTNAYSKSLAPASYLPVGSDGENLFRDERATYDSDNLSMLLESTCVVLRSSYVCEDLPSGWCIQKATPAVQGVDFLQSLDELVHFPLFPSVLPG